MRRYDGTETWHRLLGWEKDSAAAERLAAVILKHEGYRNVDPSHPLGGRDGLKDMILSHEGKKWIGAVYFPRGKKQYSEIKKKFLSDCLGAEKNKAGGVVFVTNQELKLSERKDLKETQKIDIEILHLGKLCMILNSPAMFGTRLEFLDIDMSNEEQLSYFAEYSSKLTKIENTLSRLSNQLEERRDTDADEADDESGRSVEEILQAESEFLDKIWFDRHLSLKYRIEQGYEEVNPGIWKGALESAQKVIEKYGEQNLGPYSDFEWGMLNGKLSALRWVLGEEWDMLDT